MNTILETLKRLWNQLFGRVTGFTYTVSDTYALAAANYAQLKRGTQIKILDEIYKITAVFEFYQGNYRWVEYRLENTITGARRYLEIERDDGEWIIYLYHTQVPNTEVTLPQHSWDEVITYNGTAYTLNEWGKALMFETEHEYNLEYADYRADDGRRLSIERYYDGNPKDDFTDVEIWIGDPYNSSNIEIYRT